MGGLKTQRELEQEPGEGQLFHRGEGDPRSLVGMLLRGREMGGGQGAARSEMLSSAPRERGDASTEARMHLGGECTLRVSPVSPPGLLEAEEHSTSLIGPQEALQFRGM